MQPYIPYHSDSSHLVPRPFVRNWSYLRASRRQPIPSTKCLQLRSRLPVVCDLNHLIMGLIPDHMCIVVTGDDSGDDSGDEGPGREREDEEDTEENVSPVGETVKICQPPANSVWPG